jgi:hypothetical protein
MPPIVLSRIHFISRRSALLDPLEPLLDEGRDHATIYGFQPSGGQGSLSLMRISFLSRKAAFWASRKGTFRGS